MACKEKIAYIPDNPDLYEHLTGIQYLSFIGDIFQVEKDGAGQRIKTYADAFELTKNLGDLISSYSHGMKQKLAIISALIHAPKLLVLDEPFVGLDPTQPSTPQRDHEGALRDRAAPSSFPPTCWMWQKSSATRSPSSRRGGWSSAAPPTT